jgi:hypothetical protein
MWIESAIAIGWIRASPACGYGAVGLLLCRSAYRIAALLLRDERMRRQRLRDQAAVTSRVAESTAGERRAEFERCLCRADLRPAPAQTVEPTRGRVRLPPPAVPDRMGSRSASVTEAGPVAKSHESLRLCNENAPGDRPAIDLFAHTREAWREEITRKEGAWPE